MKQKFDTLCFFSGFLLRQFLKGCTLHTYGRSILQTGYFGIYKYGVTLMNKDDKENLNNLLLHPSKSSDTAQAVSNSAQDE